MIGSKQELLGSLDFSDTGELGSSLGFGVGRDKFSPCLLHGDAGLDAQDQRAGLKVGPTPGTL